MSIQNTQQRTLAKWSEKWSRKRPRKGDSYEYEEYHRVVEGLNHRFTLEVLTRDFRSGDLERSRKNLRRDREQPTDVLDRIDLKEVTERLRNLLEMAGAQSGECRIGLAE